MAAQRRGTFFIVLLLVALILLFALPKQLPTLEQIHHRPHAVQRHGADALSARDRLDRCRPVDLRVKLCVGPPMTVVFWCETGEQLCPGLYATIGGVEKTAFIRPCSQWAKCK